MSKDKTSPSSSSVNRRSFFRHMLLKGVEKFEQMGHAVGQSFEHLHDLEGSQQARAADSRPRYVRYLRPPGALSDVEFTRTCSQCGLCVEACPADAIKLDDRSPSELAGKQPVAAALPYIVARDAPCVMCDDLSCMKVCPTGALQLVDKPELIDLGHTVADHYRCLRGESGGKVEVGDEDCRQCIDQCPVGAAALTLDEHGMIDILDGCTGCGVCERACPTDPPSIWVEPHSHN